MTTIAYRDGLVAVDTQVGDCPVEYQRKWGKLADGRVVAACGNGEERPAVMAWLDQGGEPSRFPKLEEIQVIVFDAVSVYEYLPHSHGHPYERKPEPFFAWGSGADVAIGAMAAGASAEEAVRIAARYDVHTGGEIEVIHLRSA